MSKGDILACYCGLEFEATNNRQKYCSSRCAQRLLQKRWNDQHPDKRAAIARRYKDRHPEKVRAQKAAARRRAGALPKSPRARPITPRMPEAKWDPQRYYLDKQHGDRLLRTYGITAEDYQRMWDEQGGVCAICHQPETQMVRRKTLRRLCVDHNAKTGKVRALLCAQCNLGIGNSQEHPEWFEAAASYLRFWNTEEPPEGG